MVGDKTFEYRMLIPIGDPTTNNCGLNWSDGRIQSSVSEFKTKPVNRLDYTCQEHDRSCKLAGGDVDKLNKADDEFFKENFLSFDHPFRGTAYALAVYTNRFRRKKNLRGGMSNTLQNGGAKTNYGTNYIEGDNERASKRKDDLAAFSDVIYAPVSSKSNYKPVQTVYESEPAQVSGPINKNDKPTMNYTVYDPVSTPGPANKTPDGGFVVPQGGVSGIGGDRQKLPTVDMSKYSPESIESAGHRIDYNSKGYQDFNFLMTRKKFGWPSFKRKKRIYIS
jgi:hypothetical protein